MNIHTFVTTALLLAATGVEARDRHIVNNSDQMVDVVFHEKSRAADVNGFTVYQLNAGARQTFRDKTQGKSLKSIEVDFVSFEVPSEYQNRDVVITIDENLKPHFSRP